LFNSAKQCASLGKPLLVKAADGTVVCWPLLFIRVLIIYVFFCLVVVVVGGGGKGMRIVEEPVTRADDGIKLIVSLLVVLLLLLVEILSHFKCRGPLGEWELSTSLLTSLASARRESAAAFGSTRILVKRNQEKGRKGREKDAKNNNNNNNNTISWSDTWRAVGTSKFRSSAMRAVVSRICSSASAACSGGIRSWSKSRLRYGFY
jgi:hypothetical protein